MAEFSKPAPIEEVKEKEEKEEKKETKISIPKSKKNK